MTAKDKQEVQFALPFNYVGPHVQDAEYHAIARGFGEDAEQKAQFIVHACNSHEVLTEALMKMYDAVKQMGWGGSIPSTMSFARIALSMEDKYPPPSLNQQEVE